ncbi:MAG: uracil-DNA glycosylase [Gammaproteobacteria bacterium]|nr:uracil-DNA glycosylase [Gammaproteobacteria bacterium]
MASSTQHETQYELLAECRLCPRLVAHLQETREQHAGYHAAPVKAWGRTDARLLIVGLAPGMHGANRTGRPFTGDASGSFLFEALAVHGFATHPRADDAKLTDTRITNAVKCLPPHNKPNAREIRTCARYLSHELRQLWREGLRRPRCVLCLGRVAHDSVAEVLGESSLKFIHGQCFQTAPGFWLVDSYHPSRQNVNTGRLTQAMLHAVLAKVRGLLAQ